MSHIRYYRPSPLTHLTAPQHPFEDEDDDEDDFVTPTRKSPTRQSLKDKTFQIFGLRKMRQNRMIERL